MLDSQVLTATVHAVRLTFTKLLLPNLLCGTYMHAPSLH